MKSSSSNGSVFVWDGAYSNSTTSSTSVMDEKNGDFDEVCVCVTTSSDRSHLLTTNKTIGTANQNDERMTRSQCDLKQTMKQTAWSAGNQDYQIAIGFNIATEMVADRTEKGKNQCNFVPLYTPFVKLSQHFIGKNNTLRSIIFVFFKQKTWRVNHGALSWSEKNKTAGSQYLFCVVYCFRSC